jgi:hypothetical protein
MALRYHLPALGALLLLAAGAAAEVPEAGLRERQGALEAAGRSFESGDFDRVLAELEAAAGATQAPLPMEAVRQWGIAAAESGWPLTAHLRLRQYLASRPDAVDRATLEARVVRAREALLARAPIASRGVATSERRPDWEREAERQVVRLAARNGNVTVEALQGARVQSPVWARAGELSLEAYLDLVRRLLDDPAVLVDVPAQRFDPNAPGPRRAVTLRLVIGTEERALEALRGESHARLENAAALVLEFARAAPAARPAPAR